MNKKALRPKNTLFNRVAAILEEARSNVVHSINNTMVLAYWQIGKEIVEEVQHGKNRAGYGDQIIETLSLFLTEQYGRGFSTTNLRYFRMFYSVYIEGSL